MRGNMAIKMKYSILISFLISLVISIAIIESAYTCDPIQVRNLVASITVDANDIIKYVKRIDSGKISVLGSIINGHPVRNGALYHVRGRGVWDTNNYRSNPEAVKLAKDIGASFMRYSMRDWTHAVGPVDKRPHIYWGGEFYENGSQILNQPITFGLPEALQFIDDIDAVPVILLPVYLDPNVFTEQDAADLVKYLNVACEVPLCITEIYSDADYNNICEASNLYENGTSVNWPQVRICDKYALGRADLDIPWNVVWFEYGNETWGMCSFDTKQEVDECAKAYIEDYRNFRSIMQGIDPDIKLGINLAKGWKATIRGSQGIIQGTGDIADFYIIHKYLPWYRKEDYTSVNDIFKYGLAGTNGQLKSLFNELNMIIGEMNYGISVPLAVTEFNGGYETPRTSYLYRSLGNALVNAEFIRQLMHADNVILGTGSRFSDIVDIRGHNTLRPIYYTYKFYNNFFGDILINSAVHVDSYEIKEGEERYGVEIAKGIRQNERLYADELAGLIWNINNSNPANDSIWQDNGILTLNFNGLANDKSAYAFKETSIMPATLYRLSGFIKTENISSSEGIYLTVQNGKNLVANGNFEEISKGGATHWIKRDDSGLTVGVEIIEMDGNNVENIHSGERSLRMDFSNATKCMDYWQQGIYQKNIEVSPNTTYTIEAYIKTDGIELGDREGAYGVRLYVRDEKKYSGKYIYPPLYTEALEGTHDWTYVSREFTTSHDTDSVKIHVTDNAICNGTAWVDDVKIINKTTAQDIYGTKKFSGTEGNEHFWSYVTGDFLSANQPLDSSGLVNAKVFVGRNNDGTAISGRAMFRDVKLRKFMPRNFGEVPYLSVNASKSADEKKLYFIVVNLNMENNIAATISLDNFKPISAKRWLLNGEFVDSTNENRTDVDVTFERIDPFLNGSTIIFPRHSLSALIVDSEGVMNGDFENTYTDDEGIFASGWLKLDKRGTIVEIEVKEIDGSNTRNIHSGQNALRINYSRNKFWNLNIQGVKQTNVIVSPNTEYRLEGYIKTEGVTVGEYGGHGVGISIGYENTNQVYYTPLFAGTRDWTYISTKIITSDETEPVFIKIAGSGIKSGIVWVDDVKLINMTSALDM